MATGCVQHSQPFQNLPYYPHTSECGQQEDILAFQVLPVYLELLEDPHITSNWPTYSSWNPYFPAKCHWGINIHCLPVLGDEQERRVWQQWFMVMEDVHWVSGAPETHHLFPSTPSHVHSPPLLMGISSPARSPLAPSHPWVSVQFSVHQWDRSWPPNREEQTPPSPAFHPASIPHLPNPLCSTLTFWHTMCSLVCLLSHEGRDFFSLVTALSPVPRMHPGRQGALKNYTFND